MIIATNPVGGAGIGVDPVYLTDALGIFDENGVPCHNIENPFSMDTWEGMPGYDGHHGDGGGIYVEDCGGAGGNVCFSVNGAIDPVPGSHRHVLDVRPRPPRDRPLPDPRPRG